MNRQPRALYLLNFISMWECFSYYGMRSLLVLFMIHEMSLNDSQAFGLYALYITLIELGGMAGGIIADRFLGLKLSIVIGGWTIMLGHLCLIIPSQEAFFLGLGTIIAGTSLFRSNVAALLGEFYQDNDPRREAGYTIYYSGINIGGFLASLSCAYAAEIYGWHAGFSLAAFGMLLGNICLLWKWNMLAEIKSPDLIKQKTLIGILGLTLAGPFFAFALYYKEFTALFVPLLALGGICFAIRQTATCTPKQKSGFNFLAVLIMFLIIFYVCEEQLGSSLVLFAERHVDRKTLFGIIPAASLITFNPSTILIAGPLLARFINGPIKGLNKIMIGFSLLGSAFYTLYAGCMLADSNEVIPLVYAAASIIMIALGELFIAPTVFSYASQAAPRHLQGITMGMVTMGFALANLFSGFLSQKMVGSEEGSSMNVYSEIFGIIGFAVLCIAAFLLILNFRKKAVAI
ncbi:MAG: peptide MFS transporter [Candidatus Protochlamydia sp.]|nr:peptide MFS transporter [Candidatus Protochlamydia sp.]